MSARTAAARAWLTRHGAKVLAVVQLAMLGVLARWWEPLGFAGRLAVFCAALVAFVAVLLITTPPDDDSHPTNGGTT